MIVLQICTAASSWQPEFLACSDASGIAQSDFLVYIETVLVPTGGTKAPRADPL